ncbi:MAG: hypothetical protein JST54_09890 [Deltaproteobacteria bacterium]|nr:hypothetical protein [Deltaproteobacteria bacterium]
MKRILMVLAMAGATSGGAAFAQQAPGGAPSGAEATPPEVNPAPAELAPPPAPVEHHAMAGPVWSLQGEGGIQAFSGPMSDFLRAGPAWGADADIAPAHVPLGFELRYQGASNQLFGSGNFWTGPREARVVQNGGDAMLKASLASNARSMLEPYVAGGIGFAHYSLQEPVAGFQSDGLGEVPVSAGINYRPRLPNGVVSSFTVGLRGDYKWLFSDQFAPTNIQTDYGVFVKQGGDTYRGQITMGGTF